MTFHRALRPLTVGCALLVLTIGSAGLAAAPAQADAVTFTDHGISYQVTGANTVKVGNGVITACPSTCPVDESGSLAIPSTVSNGATSYAVTAIADRAFMDHSEIVGAVTIPNTVTSLGLQSFYQSSAPAGITAITFGSGVNSIGGLAFAGTAIAHLDIPANVTSIGGSAFADVPNLQTVEINGGSALTVGNGAFVNNSPNTTLQYVRFRGNQPTIPANAFDGHTGCELRYTATAETPWSEPLPAQPDCQWIETDVPTITEQPAATNARSGATATFQVAASGDGTVSYQWYRNGVEIAGANATTLAVPAVTAADTGAEYSVSVQNWVGSVASNPATLTVTNPTPQPAKGSQSISLKLKKTLKRKTAYVLPTHTVQGTPVRWTASKPGKCTITGARLVCRKKTGKKAVVLTATAPESDSLMSFRIRLNRTIR